MHASRMLQFAVNRLNRGLSVLALSTLFASIPAAAADSARGARPNVLFAISDDQSWEHTSAAGARCVNTPAFDRVAKLGVRFTQAFAPSPGCSPSRAATLAGRNCWELEQAGTHASSFPRYIAVYPDLLAQAGYHVGMTGKGWGPGNWKITGWPHNPAGPSFGKHSYESKEGRPGGASANDYAANFADFLQSKPKDQPFCFWFGCTEPHRGYEKGSGLKAGKQLADAVVPAFLPDTEEVRSDILDYCLEIEWFDAQLGRMLKTLEDAGELANTLIVVTADDGMAFPRAKANCYEYGTHVPLAICWPAQVPGGRVIDDLVSFVDFAPTYLEAAGAAVPPVMRGRSLLNVLASDKQGLVDPERRRVFTSRERHSSARPNNVGYPCRALRTQQYVYIRNFHPEFWPAGDPVGLGKAADSGFYDIDGSPTKTLLMENRDREPYSRFFHLAVDKRPAEELYDAKNDPANLTNLAGRPENGRILVQLRAELIEYLTATSDPRALGTGEIFETYPRYSAIRSFPATGGR